MERTHAPEAPARAPAAETTSTDPTRGGQASSARGGSDIGDFASSLGASPGQLAAFDQAVARVRVLTASDRSRIDHMRLQEIDYLLELLGKKTAKEPKDPIAVQAETYAKERKAALEREAHATATNRSDERKRTMWADGSSVSGGRSKEIGASDHHAVGRELGPRDGDKVSINKQTVEAVDKTLTVTRTTTQAGAGPAQSGVTATASDNTKPGEKTTLKDETTTAERRGQTTTSRVDSHEQNDKGTVKSSTRESVVDDRSATIRETKRETSTLLEAKKAKEKKDQEEREKLRSQDPDVQARLQKLDAEAKAAIAAAKTPEERARIEKEAADKRSALIKKDPGVAKSVKLVSGEKTLATAGQDRKYKGSAGPVKLEAEAATAELKASGDIGYDPTKGVTVTGTLGGKATLVGGSAKIETPPVDFTLGGESLQATMYVSLSSAVLAEAAGAIAINASKNAGKVGIELAQGEKRGGVGAGAKASAFIGAKAGIEVGAKVDWIKKASYRDEVTEMLKKKMPEFIAKRLPAERIATVLIGSGGRSTVIGLKGGFEGTSGIGGEAGGTIAFAGGRLRVEGKFQGTFGLGVGSSLRADIDAIDGMRLLAILIVRAAHLAAEFGITPERVWDWVKQRARAVYQQIRGG